MTPAPAQFGLTPGQRATPNASVWRAILATFSASLRVAIPGIIQSFDPVTQTVAVKVAVTDTVRVLGNLQPLIITTLENVPICIPRAGGFSITFPVQQGDECLLITCDQDIDNWFQGGSSQSAPITGRRHNISDTVAVLGIWSQPRKLTDYATDGLCIRSDDHATEIKLMAGGTVNVTCQNATVNASNSINASANGAFNLSGSPVTIHSAGNDTVIDGHTWLLHEHSGVTTGGGISGPVL